VNVKDINISSVPQPFREFLSGGAKAGQDISAAGIEAGQKENNKAKGQQDMQDLMFLAAILMMCDE